MKKLILLFPLLLTSCAYFISSYDPIEYEMITNIRTLAQVNIQNCSDIHKSKKVVDKIYFEANKLRNFEEFIPDNQDSINSSEKMLSIVNELKSMYSKDKPPSKFYCEEKLDTVLESATYIQKAAGNKPR